MTNVIQFPKPDFDLADLLTLTLLDVCQEAPIEDVMASMIAVASCMVSDCNQEERNLYAEAFARWIKHGGNK